MDDLDCLSVEKLVAKIEAKETARNALNSSYTSSAGISSFRKCEESKAAEEKKLKIEVKCLDCDNKINNNNTTKLKLLDSLLQEKIS